MPFWVGPCRSYFRLIPAEGSEHISRDIGLKPTDFDNRQGAKGWMWERFVLVVFLNSWCHFSNAIEYCYALGFMKHTLPHVSTCLAVFCFSLQTDVNRVWRQPQAFTYFFDSLNVIAAMDAGLTLRFNSFCGQPNPGHFHFPADDHA